MCVIAFAWKVHPRWRLLLIGNRDETHERPSALLQRWPEAPHIIAGRDLEAGGTWMGVRGPDRAAVVTNVRDPRASQDGASRGLLVVNYLRGFDSAARHAAAVSGDAVRYRPFNLLLFDTDRAWLVSNHPLVQAVPVPTGLHGLANRDLDSGSPRVRRATAVLRAWLESGRDDDYTVLFEAFADKTPQPQAALPDPGAGFEQRQKLWPLFVRDAHYGTRATTLIAMDHKGGLIVEHRFGPNGVPQGQTTLRFGANGVREGETRRGFGS